MAATLREIVPLSGPPDATVTIPGSKSHTNRALVCAALAPGISGLEGALFADDTIAMLSSLLRLGVKIFADEVGRTVTVFGSAGTLPAGPADLDVRMSGTTSRFLLPMLCLGEGPYRVDGDEQLRQRPIGELVNKLRHMGADIDNGELPLTIAGGGLEGGSTTVQGSVSSQFLSGLLLSAPYMAKGLTIRISTDLVSKPYVALTLDTMRSFGLEVSADKSYRQFDVPAGQYRPTTLQIEPDASAASYFFAAAAITGGRVRVEGLGSSTTQGDIDFVKVLERMGAEVSIGPDATEVRGTGTLRGIEVNMADISDTAQTLAAVATFADSPTEMTGIGFIRHKETDRIAAPVSELSKLGIRAEERPDGLVVHPGTPRSGVVNTYDDHRMAMSFALLGLVHPGVHIANPGCVAKTFPDFFEVLETLR